MYTSNLNAGDIKQQVSLVDLLAALGYEPSKRTGRELVYTSMLRDTDIKPSFSVNNELNVWYDHGTAKGGNIIDFAMAYWKLTFVEALKKIAAVSGQNFSIAATGEKRVRKHARKLPHYCVEEIKPLGNNPIITEYIYGRGIWPVAQKHLQEVYYFVEDDQKIANIFLRLAGKTNYAPGKSGTFILRVAWAIRQLLLSAAIARTWPCLTAVSITSVG